MLYSSPKTSPRSLLHHLANAGGAVLVGLMFAFIGLNVASGCGQQSGQCIAMRDFIPGPAMDARQEKPGVPPAG
jgi:hypothetical protein